MVYTSTASAVLHFSRSTSANLLYYVTSVVCLLIQHALNNNLVFEPLTSVLQVHPYSVHAHTLQDKLECYDYNLMYIIHELNFELLLISSERKTIITWSIFFKNTL